MLSLAIRFDRGTGRVREPWVRAMRYTSPRTRERQRVAQGESASPGYARWGTQGRVLAGDSM